MSLRRAFPACLLAVVALAGCGSDEPSTPAAAAAKPADAAPVQVAATEGRTGDATQASGAGLENLSPGGRISPRAARPTPRQREGVGAGAACADVDVTPTADNLPVVEQATLCLINGERADRGLVALTTNGELAQAALRHARDMVEQGFFSHSGSDGSTLTDRIRDAGYLSGDDWLIGENLAWGTGSLATPRAIVNAWMNSEGHRQNILNARFRETGFGTVIGSPSSSTAGATYANEFGVRNSSQTSSTAPAADSGDTGQETGAAPQVAGKRQAFPSRRVLARKRRACKRRDTRRARVACKARVARIARRARAARG